MNKIIEYIQEHIGDIIFSIVLAIGLISVIVTLSGLIYNIANNMPYAIAGVTAVLSYLIFKI